MTELTDREMQVVRLVCEGLNYREIGERLFRSARTIDNYRDSIFEKLDVKTMAHAISKLYQQGILKIEEEIYEPNTHRR